MTPVGAQLSSRLKRAAVAFGHFWWDFLVGDTPELFVGGLIVLGLIALLVHLGAPRAVPVIALPALAIALLAATLLRARKSG